MAPRACRLLSRIVGAVRKDLLRGDTCISLTITLSPTSPPPRTLYRHLHRFAGRISIALAAEAIVVPEVRVETRPALTTLVPTLDRILGPLEAGKITLIDSGSDFVFHLTTLDRKSTRLNSSHVKISYAVFCLKKKKKTKNNIRQHRY